MPDYAGTIFTNIIYQIIHLPVKENPLIMNGNVFVTGLRRYVEMTGILLKSQSTACITPTGCIIIMADKHPSVTHYIW